jgi:toxin CptA
MGPAALAAIPVALLSAALMGMAIQRGATCMVAAVDEAIVERRYRRALALAEAALWVGGLVAVAQLAGGLHMTPAHYPVGALTIAGGVFLGLGAWINRACVFGAVARIGSGQWAYFATPLGFYLGCLIPIGGPVASAGGAPFVHALPVAFAFGLLAVWRLAEAARAPQALDYLWHPHRATLLIAVTFVTTMLTVGLWAYTDALAALAHSKEARLGLRGTMVLALLGGAVFGGLIEGKLRHQPVRAADIVRCLIGGALMGFGGMLVPGSNDGLIMVGLPLLRPYAWIAVATMAGTISAAIMINARLAKVPLRC